MVDASKLLVSGVGLMVLAGCTPHDLPHLEADDRVEDHGEAIDGLIASAVARVDEGEPREALHELMEAAELAAAINPRGDLDGAARCDFASDSAEIAAELTDRGAYAESRMAYAVALNFADSCAAEVREDLRARREDVRATQQWSLEPPPEIASELNQAARDATLSPS